MPTTETFVWDCPECCDEPTSSSGGVCTNGATLNASGAITGSMTGTGPWTFSGLVPGTEAGMCAYFIQVFCTDGVLSATGALTGNAAPACATPSEGAVSILSHNPILIDISFLALASGCGCAGGVVTISE